MRREVTRMGLGGKQRKFSLMVAQLIAYAYSIGYEVTFGDAFRDKRCKYGHRSSLHQHRLAIDLNLFKNGIYLTDGEGHVELHDYWDKLGGSERIKHDLNHYSLGHFGMV